MSERILTEEQLKCKACQEKKYHTPEDWKNHKFAGHGYNKEQGYSHPDLKQVMEDEKRKKMQLP